MDSYHHQPSWDNYPNLNIASLSVTSPTNLSPATPLSPYHHQLHSQFNFDHQNNPFDDRNPQQSTPSSSSRPSTSTGPPPTSSASSASSAPLLNPPLPRKRSSSSAASTLVQVEESIYDDPSSAPSTVPLDLATPSEDHEMRSPIDGSGSTSGAEDSIVYGGSSTPGGLQDSARPGGGSASSGGMPLGMAGSMNILGKPMATNNFVTKLYQ